MALLKNGYNLIYRNHKHIYEHRFLMEQFLGRTLKSSEQVHHKNGIRDDNRLENLVLTSNIKDHRKEHQHWGRPKQRPCYCGKPAHGQNLCRNHYARTFRQVQGW